MGMHATLASKLRRKEQILGVVWLGCNERSDEADSIRDLSVEQVLGGSMRVVGVRLGVVMNALILLVVVVVVVVHLILAVEVSMYI